MIEFPRQRQSSIELRVGLLAGVLAVTGIFWIQLCDAVFFCGCGPVWGSFTDHCNVHSPHTPDCPWCEHPWTGALALLPTVALQFALLLSPVRYHPLETGVRTAFALLAAPALGAGIGVATSIVMGYSKLT